MYAIFGSPWINLFALPKSHNYNLFDSGLTNTLCGFISL